MSSSPGPAGRSSLAAGLTKYQGLLMATCVATFTLIIIGGTVRATGSGDACPDWPRCHGQLIPPFETKVMIEFSHRLAASIVGFLVLAVAISGWRSQMTQLLRWGGVLAFGLVTAQVILGGATVLSELSPNVVMAHLALASALFATLIILAVASFAADGQEKGSVSVGYRNVAVGVTIAVFAVMMSGSYVSGSGAALVFRDWPLFDGSVLPGVRRLEVIHASHRLAVVALGLVLAYVAHHAGRARFENPILRYGPLVAFVLFLTQALVGAANIWTLLQPSAAAAHLALAELLWGTFVLVAAVAYMESAPLGHRTQAKRTVGDSAPNFQPTVATGETS